MARAILASPALPLRLRTRPSSSRRSVSVNEIRILAWTDSIITLDDASRKISRFDKKRLDRETRPNYHHFMRLENGSIRHLRHSFNDPGHAHEFTFCCYRGYKLLSKDRPREWFVDALDRADASITSC